MKVLLVNGSPHSKGCTYTALAEVATELEKAGVSTEIFNIGNKPVRGCIACQKCKNANATGCIFDDDPANQIINKMIESDGLIVGTPVYYSSPNGALISILDRAFYAGGKNFIYKPAAAVVSARRGGTTSSLDVINKYFNISKMPVVSSQYWNMVHGMTPDEVRQDYEGLQIMRVLGRNMAWLLKCIEAGKVSGINYPDPEKERISTSFIR